MNDVISRQAAIDYCYQLINVEHQQGSDEMNYGQERVNQTETILHHLELMPSAQPDLEEAYICGETEAEARFHAQQRWIPCSERLPEFKYETYDADDDYTFWDTDFVIGATSRGTLSIGQFTRDSDKPNEFHWDACECDAFDLQGCLRIGDHIIAWMPVPESYTEDKE